MWAGQHPASVGASSSPLAQTARVVAASSQPTPLLRSCFNACLTSADLGSRISSGSCWISVLSPTLAVCSLGVPCHVAERWQPVHCQNGPVSRKRKFLSRTPAAYSSRPNAMARTAPSTHGHHRTSVLEVDSRAELFRLTSQLACVCLAWLSCPQSCIAMLQPVPAAPAMPRRLASAAGRRA